jgi:hypothetical protein
VQKAGSRTLRQKLYMADGGSRVDAITVTPVKLELLRTFWRKVRPTGHEANNAS